jgi:hypothetical protein
MVFVFSYSIYGNDLLIRALYGNDLLIRALRARLYWDFCFYFIYCFIHHFMLYKIYICCYVIRLPEDYYVMD